MADPGAAAALAAYHAMKARGQLRRLLLIEDWCPRHCLLLRVWRGTGGVLYAYLPAYRLSPARNAATSDPGARAKRTRDGDRRWEEHVTVLSNLVSNLAGQHAGESLKCDHVDVFVRADELIERAAKARPGRPDRRDIPG